MKPIHSDPFREPDYPEDPDVQLINFKQHIDFLDDFITIMNLRDLDLNEHLNDVLLEYVRNYEPPDGPLKLRSHHLPRLVTDSLEREEFSE